ncbi:cation transporter, partial [bacterium AH-315-J04]|nr:cation transporter [bacterium AH-315-J04]
RCRKINNQIWIDVHVLVPGELSTLEAHGRVTQVETSLEELFPKYKVIVTSHMEPDDHEAVHPGGHDEVSDPIESAHHHTH